MPERLAGQMGGASVGGNVDPERLFGTGAPDV